MVSVAFAFGETGGRTEGADRPHATTTAQSTNAATTRRSRRHEDVCGSSRCSSVSGDRRARGDVITLSES
jgi:hypothetical protein